MLNINESFIDVLINISKDVGLGNVLNNTLVIFGGLAGATLIYFIFMLAFEYRNYKRQKDILKEIKSIKKDIKLLKGTDK